MDGKECPSHFARQQCEIAFLSFQESQDSSVYYILFESIHFKKVIDHPNRCHLVFR